MKIATIKEIAAFLSMKESTLYSWVGSSLIPSFKLNALIRFDLDEIRQWVINSREEGKRTRYSPKGGKGGDDIDSIIKKAIEDEKNKGYTQINGKPA